MPRKLYFLLLATLLSLPAFSYSDTSVVMDQGKLTLRNFDKAQLLEYGRQREFIYGDIKIDTSPSLWHRFWSWFWSLFDHTISDASSGRFSQYFFLILGCSAIIYAIFKLIGMDARLIFTSKPKVIDLPYTEAVENIHQIPFDAEIGAAINNGDYRLAVRLLYLKTLKRLNDSGKIKWQAGKTNSEYLREIRHVGQKDKFRLLTRQFEYVWYGSFPVDATSFSKINLSFDEFFRGSYK